MRRQEGTEQLDDCRRETLENQGNQQQHPQNRGFKSTWTHPDGNPGALVLKGVNGSSENRAGNE